MRRSPPATPPPGAVLACPCRGTSRRDGAPGAGYRPHWRLARQTIHENSTRRWRRQSATALAQILCIFEERHSKEVTDHTRGLRPVAHIEPDGALERLCRIEGANALHRK